MKGLQLINEINAIRACRSEAPIARISLAGALSREDRCPLESIIGAEVTLGSCPEWAKRCLLRFDDIALARAVAAEIGRPHASDRPEVLAPDAIDSFVIALAFGLVFEDDDGFLRGWIEPTDGDPSVWDLHLMPGEKYPPGHEPAADGREPSAAGRRRGSRPAVRRSG